MADCIWDIRRAAFSRLPIIFHCQRSHVWLQSLHVRDVVHFCRCELLRVDERLYAVFGVVGTDKAGGFGTLAGEWDDDTHFIRPTKITFLIAGVLQMGTLASLHGSANPSIYSSRPITPYTVSTLPMHWHFFSVFILIAIRSSGSYKQNAQWTKKSQSIYIVYLR